jgi:flagellar hook-associated protein 1 FlgK
VQQLQNQRNSVSGVSLDEEAANLVQFQRAYQAAARIVNVIDTLTQTAINLGVGGT